MKVAVLFSGGKDSTMALYNALETGEDVKYLLSMKSVNDESYMFHVPNIHITDLLAEALNIPIITAQTQGIKEEELEDLKMAFIKLKDLGVEAIYTGALYSVYQKSRIEKLGDEVGLEIISPYWHVDELEYMKEIVSLGFEVIISGVFAYGLDESWLGRKIDDKAIDEICVIGHSLSGVDKNYFNRIDNLTKGRLIWKVYYYHPDEKEKLKNNLLDIGIDTERIKLIPSEEFYDL